MTLQKRAFGWRAAWLCLGLLLTACSTDEDEEDSPNLEGRWSILTTQEKGWVLDEEGNREDVDTKDTLPSETFLELKADKTFTSDLPQDAIGTWSVDKDTLIQVFNVHGDTFPIRSHYTVNGREATLESRTMDEESDITLTTVLRKE